MRCTKNFRGIRLPARAVCILVALVLAVISVALQVNTKTANAATSTTINFQARLMTSGGAIVPDGYYNVEFKLYNSASSSGSSQGSCTGDANCLWTETRTGVNTVRVANGYLTANLGSVTAFPGTINWNEELWLSMNIGGTGSPSWDGPMTPRLKLTAVGYAFRAGQLAKTDSGFTSVLDFVQPTANRSILLPDASGTVCLQASAACGFMTGSPGDYIQNNQTVTPQSANIFIQNAGANSADTATIKLGSSQTGAGLNVTDSSNTSIWKVTSGLVSQSVGLRLNVNSTTADTFVTPQGTSVKSAINIPIYDPGAFGQLLAFGLPSTAQNTARAISVFDGRTSGVIQPAIAVFSPNENDVFGLSWNGLNTVASLETGSAAIALRPGGVNVKLWAGSTGVAIGNNVSSASYPLDVTGDINTSTQYRINGTVICTASGCTPAAGSANYIQNQNSTNQSADYRISGTGRANTAMMTPLLQPTVDGTTAMKIQNTGATVTAMAIDTTNGRVTIGADTAAQEKLDVVGNLQVRDAVTATKSYRLRTTGGALDLEGAGANLVLSLWSAAGYTGTQYNQITFKSDGSSMDFARGFNVSDAAARVGLAGNINPQYSLDVNGDINTSTQYRINGTVICTASGCTPAAGSANYIQNTTTLQSANMAVQAASSGSVAAVLQANASGTGDILSLRNGAGTAVATFGYNGATLFKNSTDSAAALRVQNAAGTNVLLVDTANQRVAIGNTAPALKFEVQDGDAAIYNNGNNARLVLGDNATTGQYGWLQWDSTNDYFRIETAGSNGLKVKDNNVSIGNIFPSKPLIVGTGTTPLFEIGTTGQVQTRTSTNTATAFQIQNNLGDVYFNGDSINKRVGIGDNMIAPEVTLDVSGAIQQTGMETPNTGATDNNKWTKLGTCTLTAQFSQCVTKLEILGGYDGSTGNNAQATVTARVKQQNAMGAAPYINVTLNDTAEVITKSDIVAVTTVNTGATTTVELYGRVTNTFETWAYTPVLNAGGFGDSTWDWNPGSAFIAALPGGTQTVARFGNVNANLFLAEATNTSAAVIQNAGGANKLFVADTTNLRVAINQAAANYTLDVAGDVNTSTQYRIGGTAICTAAGCTASATSAILNQATVQSANFYVQAATSGSVAGILRANAAGAGNILNLQNGAGTNVGTVSSTGAMTLQNSTNSTSAFLIQAAAGGGGNAVFRVDTTNERIAIGVISDPIAAKLNIATSSTVSLRAFQGSTNEIFQLANSSGDVFNVASGGSVNVRTRTDSATGFRIQNSAGTQVLNLDTIDNILMLGTGFGAKHIAMDIETNPYIEIGDSSGTNAVSLVQTEGSNAYLVHDSDLIVQRSTDSTTDFRILNASDVDLFTANTTDSRIHIGTSDTTGALLVLDTKTGSGDPTGVDGGMYYNSNSGKFRCYENSAWRNCLNGDAESVNTISGAAGTAMTKAAAGTIILTPIYIPGRMTVNELRVAVVTTALGAAGDIGIYNSAGTLVINGGSSSVSVGIGLKTVTPTQSAGAARTLDPGQYYMAITWNAATGSINSITQSNTFIKRNGTIATGGGLVLPSSVTLSGITAANGIPAMGIAN